MTDDIPEAAYDLPDCPDAATFDADDVPDGWEAPAEVPDYDAAANPEIDTAVRLPADLTLLRRPTKRLMVDWRANPDAYRHLETMPQEGESLHAVISGRYALAELVPALIERTGQPIDDLTVATLGFSVANGVDLFALLDGGQVNSVLFVCSHYFKSTSEPIYDAIVPELVRRGHRVLSMRNHAKLILAKMVDGTCYVCESSANYRSCVNVETFVLSRCPTLYQFHRQWLEHVYSLSAPGRYGEQVNNATRWK
jgi:hypothetical protein